MPKTQLTDRFIKSAKPEPGRDRAEFFDVIVKGLSVVVFAGGTRTWFQHYTDPNSGKRQRIKMGNYPNLSLADAREKAREGRGTVAKGQGPLAEKRAAEAAMSVGDLIEAYVCRYASTKRSGKEIERRLRKSVAPVIGSIKLASLHRRDITRCIDRLTDRGVGVEANRTFEDVRAMLRWARSRGDIDNDIVGGMAKPTATTPRTRVLSADEIQTMWAALADADMWESTKRVVRMCLISGARVSEVAGMTRDEIDLDQKLWTIPSARMKNAREHKVPLSRMAVAVIEDQLRDAEALAVRKGRPASQFAFAGPGGQSPLTNFAIAKAIKRQSRKQDGQTLIMGVQQWTCHDLRRSMATHMEPLVGLFVVGHLLGHVSLTKSTITAQVYGHHDYAREKRQAMDLWSDRLDAFIAGKGGVVVPFRSTVA